MPSTGRGALILLGGLGLASAAALAAMAPIPQDQSYHAFADARPALGIPNFWNVVSNLPFVAVGAAGLALFRKDAPATALFTGFLLTGFGSAYYHVAPDDGTLFWDRLPMTISFMALLAGALGERFGEAAGRRALWPLLALGAASLLWWRWTGGTHAPAASPPPPPLCAAPPPPRPPPASARYARFVLQCSILLIILF